MRLSDVFGLALATALLASACARREPAPVTPASPVTVPYPVTGTASLTSGVPPPPAPAGMPAPYQVGVATWYGQAFAGKKTANGERFDPSAMTAAHRKLPFGTWVEVRSVSTGRTVRVRINDRGPFGSSRRVIDLSQGAARAIGFSEVGFLKVEIRVVQWP
ncbi:MAG: septal ring lytic transglycosylase RlpA family protein [Polyangiaceae bacterium]